MFNQETINVSPPKDQENVVPSNLLRHVFLTIGKVENRYDIVGTQPKLLLTAKTHGDEQEVGECLEEVLTELNAPFPNYLFIPVISPSAAQQKSRWNRDNHDLNRSFFSGSPVPEAQWVMHVLAGHRFDLSLSFHEDPDSKDFYLYDSFGPNLEGSDVLASLRSDIKALGVDLLNGVDDPADPALGDIFLDGYHYESIEAGLVNPHGFLANWILRTGIGRRSLLPEIPGKLPRELKKELVKIILRHFVTHTF